MLKRLRKHRRIVLRQLNFLYEWTRAAVFARNEGTVIGVLWFLLGPLFTFLILLAVFHGRLGADIEHYAFYLVTGIIMWDFFNAGCSMCMRSMVMNGGLIKSLPVRRDMLVVSSLSTVLVSHLFEYGIFSLFCWWFGLLSVTWLLLPLLIIFECCFTIGMGFLLAAFFVTFRDLDQIWNFVQRVWWFATPVFYGLTATGPGIRINQFNPMYHMIAAGRDILIYGRFPSLPSFFILAGFSVVMLLIGYLFFRWKSPWFAEYL
ncbi:MAG: ABC transporter permease [Candidatus Peribacteraceae bacterium]|nr:ABC transporter permease [Candidatus Peribacteraceae bacterium]